MVSCGVRTLCSDKSFRLKRNWQNMFVSNDSNQMLKAYLEQMQIETTDDQRQLLLKHLDLVVEKNKVMNLTRITDEREALIRHIVDSLLILDTISNAGLTPDARFVDIGTGAGFPGVPLSVVTGFNGLLIDSVGKKVSAVNEFIDALDLSGTVRAEHIRAEELAKRQPNSFDIVTARAVADLGVLIEYATPLLKKGGSLVVSKAKIADEEMTRGIETGKITGMTYVSRETYELPEDEGHREILRFDKTGKSKVKLPRNTGMALHKPLV